MTAYKSARYIGDAVDGLLNQTFGDFELVVVDDGSTDETTDILRSIQDRRLRLVESRHIGRTPALILGLSEAAGEFVAVNDADDVSHPDRLQKQVDYLGNNPEVALVASEWTLLLEDGREKEGTKLPTDHKGIVNLFPVWNPIAHSTTLYRRDHAVALGGYPGEFPYAQDFALYLALASRHRLAILSEPLVKLRQHRGQMTAIPEWAHRRSLDSVRLYRRARSVPGVSRRALAKGRETMAREIVAHADALRQEGKNFKALAWALRAALWHPKFCAQHPPFHRLVGLEQSRWLFESARWIWKRTRRERPLDLDT
jgi:glycosyltransferase involved in cell wall biosynthesis